ncbi:MAG: hypothetical protein DME50_17465 [Verrucomicrobia bacterium]|nr:MAG: hypothetical protein DME50_17465 [Verrucomicrobiota bacterium]
MAGTGLSKNGLLKEAQWQPPEFMRQHGRTIRPRQRQQQQKEPHADRTLISPSSRKASLKPTKSEGRKVKAP